jgi:hypothetical protein
VTGPGWRWKVAALAVALLVLGVWALAIRASLVGGLLVVLGVAGAFVATSAIRLFALRLAVRMALTGAAVMVAVASGAALVVLPLLPLIPVIAAGLAQYEARQAMRCPRCDLPLARRRLGPSTVMLECPVMCGYRRVVGPPVRRP